MAAKRRMGIYKGGDENNTMINMIVAHHQRNLDVSANLKATYGITYHQKLIYNLDPAVNGGEPAILLPLLAAAGFAVGVQPVPVISAQDGAGTYVAIYRRTSIVLVSSPHDTYCGDEEVGDFFDAAQRAYMIRKVNRPRLYYGGQGALVSGQKLAVDFAAGTDPEPSHIIHCGVNLTTEYNTSTSAQIAAATRNVCTFLKTKGRNDPLYLHINFASADSVQRFISLCGAAWTAGLDYDEPNLEVVMIRINDPADGGALDVTQNARDACKEISAWLADRPS